jgi:hypothetical protein
MQPCVQMPDLSRLGIHRQTQANQQQKTAGVDAATHLLQLDVLQFSVRRGATEVQGVHDLSPSSQRHR